MVAFAALASFLAGASAVLAAAIPCITETCNVSSATPDLPSGQTNVTMPAGQSTQVIAVGVGVQNYTCTDDGTYTNVGAIATLCDTSCLANSPAFSSIAKDAFDNWNATSDNNIARVAEYCTQMNFPIYADHYSATNPLAPGILPIFDARATSAKDDPDAFIVANITSTLSAPTGNQDIEWALLTDVQGSLAKTVLRVDTILGQPPSSCTPGSADITVKYATNYFFLI